MARIRGQRIETYERSIKGDRLQLADPANFIHGELSRAGRQWTPFRLIVRAWKKDTLDRARAHTHREARSCVTGEKFYNSYPT